VKSRDEIMNILERSTCVGRCAMPASWPATLLTPLVVTWSCVAPASYLPTTARTDAKNLLHEAPMFPGTCTT